MYVCMGCFCVLFKNTRHPSKCMHICKCLYVFFILFFFFFSKSHIVHESQNLMKFYIEQCVVLFDMDVLDIRTSERYVMPKLFSCQIMHSYVICMNVRMCICNQNVNLLNEIEKLHFSCASVFVCVCVYVCVCN